MLIHVSVCFSQPSVGGSVSGIEFNRFLEKLDGKLKARPVLTIQKFSGPQVIIKCLGAEGRTFCEHDFFCWRELDSQCVHDLSGHLLLDVKHIGKLPLVRFSP